MYDFASLNVDLTAIAIAIKGFTRSQYRTFACGKIGYGRIVGGIF